MLYLQLRTETMRHAARSNVISLNSTVKTYCGDTVQVTPNYTFASTIATRISCRKCIIVLKTEGWKI